MCAIRVARAARLVSMAAPPGGASFAEEEAMKLSDQQALPRRTLLAGTGTAGALVAVAALARAHHVDGVAHAGVNY